MYLCIYVSMYLCIYVSMYLCIYVSMYLSIDVSMYLCIYLSIDRSIDPSIHPSIHPFIHLSLSLSFSFHIVIYADQLLSTGNGSFSLNLTESLRKLSFPCAHIFVFPAPHHSRAIRHQFSLREGKCLLAIGRKECQSQCRQLVLSTFMSWTSQVFEPGWGGDVEWCWCVDVAGATSTSKLGDIIKGLPPLPPTPEQATEVGWSFGRVPPFRMGHISSFKQPHLLT